MVGSVPWFLNEINSSGNLGCHIYVPPPRHKLVREPWERSLIRYPGANGEMVISGPRIRTGVPPVGRCLVFLTGNKLAMEDMAIYIHIQICTVLEKNTYRYILWEDTGTIGDVDIGFNKVEETNPPPQPWLQPMYLRFEVTNRVILRNVFWPLPPDIFTLQKEGSWLKLMEKFLLFAPDSLQNLVQKRIHMTFGQDSYGSTDFDLGHLWAKPRMKLGGLDSRLGESSRLTWSHTLEI